MKTSLDMLIKKDGTPFSIREEIDPGSLAVYHALIRSEYEDPFPLLIRIRNRSCQIAYSFEELLHLAKRKYFRILRKNFLPSEQKFDEGDNVC